MDSQPGFDVATLDEWIGDRLPGRGGSLQATRMGEGTGEANALYWLRRAGHVWVLRRPPAVINAPGASDMNREWRILVALEGTAVPHPAPLLLGGPDSPLGTPFLIMGRVDGFTPVGVLPAPYDNPRGRRDLGFALETPWPELAAVPWRERGLDGLGRPEEFLDRQVSRWLGRFDRLPDPGHPRAGLAGRLAGSQSAAGAPACAHARGLSPYNVMASARDTRRLAAVVDWDTGTIGDPLLDLGHLLARWTEPGEEPAVGIWDIERPPRRRGLDTQRREVVQQQRQHLGLRAGHGPNGCRRAPAQAVHHVPGRTARPWLPDHPGHPDPARGRPAGFGRGEHRWRIGRNVLAAQRESGTTAAAVGGDLF